MRLKPRLLTLLALSLLIAPAFMGVVDAQSAPVRRVPAASFGDVLFTNIDDVKAVARDDATGEVWYATGGGLVHLSADRSTRTVYGTAEGLPTPLLFDLAFDADGMLWVATDEGLSRVDVRNDTLDFTTWYLPEDRFQNSVLSFVAPAEDGTVWIGTRDHGLTHFDPEAEAWTGPWPTAERGANQTIVDIALDGDRVLVAAKKHGFLALEPGADALTPLNGTLGEAFSVDLIGDVTWFGTTRGLWRLDAAGTWQHWDGSTLSNIVVTDVARLGGRLHVTTLWGVTVFDAADMEARPLYFGTNVGLPSNRVFRVLLHEPDIAWYATQRGLHRLDLATPEAQAYVTGPVEGPNANVFFRGTVHKGRVWFGTSEGVAGFDPGNPSWTNLGVLNGLDDRSRPVFDVVSDEEDRMWLATRRGVYHANESGEWLHIQDPNGGNAFPTLVPDGDVVWLPEVGTGLLEHNWRKNETRLHNPYNGLLDPRVTSVHVDDSAVWAATYSGLYRMDRETREWTHFGRSAGFPSLYVDAMWANGRDLWVGFADDGLARFSTVDHEVTAVLNASSGTLPGDDVRDLAVQGKHLWLALGAEGVARVDPAGETPIRQLTTEDGLGVPFANGVVVHEGVLYVGTVVGMSRLHIAENTFLPRHAPDSASAVDPVRASGNGTASEAVSYPVRVRVKAPVNGEAVTGVATIRGDAAKPGGTVDRVEARVDEGPWRDVDGIAPFTFTWDTAEVQPGFHDVTVRAWSGNEVSDEEVVSLRVVAPPETPLTLKHNPPAREFFAGAPITVTAQATGDDPLSVSLYYKSPGDARFKKVSLAQDGDAWLTRIPAQDVREGAMEYYLQAVSGYLKTTLPEGKESRFTLDVVPPPPAAVDVDAPDRVSVTAGERETFALTLTNVGDFPDAYTVAASGLRAQWVTVDAAPVRLDPGDASTLAVTLNVPLDAFATTSDLTFTITPTDSGAAPIAVTVPLAITASETTGDPDAEPEDVDADVQGKATRKWWFIPAPAPVVTTVALLAVALAARSRTGRRGGDAS